MLIAMEVIPVYLSLFLSTHEIPCLPIPAAAYKSKAKDGWEHLAVAKSVYLAVTKEGLSKTDLVRGSQKSH